MEYLPPYYKASIVISINIQPPITQVHNTTYKSQKESPSALWKVSENFYNRSELYIHFFLQTYVEDRHSPFKEGEI